MKKEKKGSPPAGPGAKQKPFLPIPEGWATLIPWSSLKAGDMFWCDGFGWMKTMNTPGTPADGLIYIRKVKKARAK